MRTISARYAAMLLALMSLPPAAFAAWPAGGTLVSSPGDINGARNALIFDLPSGDLGVLGVGTGGNSFYYNVQHIGRDGSIAAGWRARAHTVSFDGLATLAPGLYFERATTRTAATSARVVVSR
jgi:hypothetical protein